MLRSKLLFLVLCVVFLHIGSARTLSQHKCVTRLDSLFLKEAGTKTTVYVADSTHSLEPIFTEACELVEIRVTPRQQSSETEEMRTDGDMSLKAYRRLLERIDRVRPLGRLVVASQFGDSSNDRSWRWFKYENALIDQSYHVPEPPRTTMRRIIGFTIFFKNIVAGRIGDRVIFNQKGDFSRAKLLVTDDWYWADGILSSRLKIKRTGRFEVFGGPIRPEE